MANKIYLKTILITLIALLAVSFLTSCKPKSKNTPTIVESSDPKDRGDSDDETHPETRKDTDRVVPKIPVWKETNTWDKSFETKYQSWIKDLPEDLFNAQKINGKENIYYGLKTDCADFVYFARAIFAYENKLPFVIKNPTSLSSRTGQLISNAMTRWGDLSEEQRVRRFLIFLSEVVSTNSISHDTYPVRLDRDTLKTGVVTMSLGETDRDMKHTTVVYDVDEYGHMYVVQSTTPRRVRRLQQRIGWMGTTRKPYIDGYRAWRHPEDLLKPAAEIEGYSTEQWELGVTNGNFETRFASKKINSAEKLLVYIPDTCRYISYRVDEVERALQVQAQEKGKCLSADDFRQLSTPSRDKYIKERLQYLLRLHQTAHKYKQPLSKDVGDMMSRFAKPDGSSIAQDLQVCAIEWSKDKYLSLPELYSIFVNNTQSSNPNDNREARWGLSEERTKCSSQSGAGT